jgi:hypothetical protein
MDAAFGKPVFTLFIKFKEKYLLSFAYFVLFISLLKPNTRYERNITINTAGSINNAMAEP